MPAGNPAPSNWAVTAAADTFRPRNAAATSSTNSASVGASLRMRASNSSTLWASSMQSQPRHLPQLRSPSGPGEQGMHTRRTVTGRV